MLAMDRLLIFAFTDPATENVQGIRNHFDLNRHPCPASHFALYPPTYPRCVRDERLPKQSSQRSFFWFDLEAIHVEDEGGKKEKGQGVSQIQCPCSQDEQQAEIHRVARKTIDSRRHQERCGRWLHGVHGGVRCPERQHRQSRDHHTGECHSHGHDSQGRKRECGQGTGDEPHAHRGHRAGDSWRNFQFKHVHGGRSKIQRDVETRSGFRQPVAPHPESPAMQKELTLPALNSPTPGPIICEVTV